VSVPVLKHHRAIARPPFTPFGHVHNSPRPAQGGSGNWAKQRR
jgi:hypothetical protein